MNKETRRRNVKQEVEKDKRKKELQDKRKRKERIIQLCRNCERESILG
jgi:hypothetical protein